MAPSVTLRGDNFFLCTGEGTNNRARERWFKSALSHGSNISHLFVTIGEEQSYFVLYKDKSTNEKHWSWGLANNYPGLATHLENKVGGCPDFVSLGEDGHYFCRSSWGSAYSLPDAAHAAVADPGDDPVDYVWLGKDNDYVLQTQGGRLRWRLSGYGALDNKLKYLGSKEIVALGLNLDDDESYCLLLDSGEYYLRGGHTALTMSEVGHWAKGVDI